MIFRFIQSNTGGSLRLPAKHIIVDNAENEFHATKAAETVGLYLDGVAKGYDCDCCGDRWGDQIYECDSIEDAVEFANEKHEWHRSMGHREDLKIPAYVIVDASEFK